jgi:hypothetical protein
MALSRSAMKKHARLLVANRRLHPEPLIAADKTATAVATPSSDVLEPRRAKLATRHDAARSCHSQDSKLLMGDSSDSS